MIRERLGTVCVSLLVLSVAFARFTEQARGDLYTNGVLCLDWLVDSSDEIVRVQFPQSPDVGLSTAEPLETLKSRSRKGSVGAVHLKELRLFPRPEPGEQWLLLFRLGRDGSPRMFRGLNLTRPLAHYSSAAVTREGRALRTREAVLAAVEAKIRLGRQLPSRCDRDAVDQMIGSEGRFKPPEIPIDAQVLANPSPLDRYLGGVRIAFNCGQWDSSERDSLDTILDRAVVSIEPEDRERIFEASRLGEKYEGKPRYYDPVYALVNYPGEEAEGILRRIVAESDGRNYRSSYHEKQRQGNSRPSFRINGSRGRS